MFSCKGSFVTQRNLLLFVNYFCLLITFVLLFCYTKELENGRLFRLIAKLGMINERPECVHNTLIVYCISDIIAIRFASDVSWSETGDRYLLKLFRDYLFHQVTPTGTPWIDLAHVVLTLNKVVHTLSVFTIELIL